jgi:hypothetical protein
VDAIPESTFLSEFYLRFRRADERAKVIPLFDIEDVLNSTSVDVAVNIHSFSECNLATVTWWINLLSRRGVRHLMIVPNHDEHGGLRLMSREADNTRRELLPVLHSNGYRLVAQQPKYLDPIVQTYGVSPTQYYLFELSI